MPNRPLIRQAIYFAGSVFMTMEVANFPVSMDGWKERAVAISVVNLLILLNAFAAGLLTLSLLKAREIRVSTSVAAGVLSGIELIQFSPFVFPLAFSWYVVIGGILGAAVPMILTLLVLGYISKGKE